MTGLSLAVDEANNVLDQKKLSPREIHVLWYMTRTPLMIKEIATKLFIEEKSTKFHCTNIYRKLRIARRVEVKHAYYERALPDYVLEYLDMPLNTLATVLEKLATDNYRAQAEERLKAYWYRRAKKAVLPDPPEGLE